MSFGLNRRFAWLATRDKTTPDSFPHLLFAGLRTFLVATFVMDRQWPRQRYYNTYNSATICRAGLGCL